MTVSPALNDLLRRTGLSDEQLRNYGVSVGDQPPRPTGPKLLDAAHAPQPKTSAIARVADLARVKRLPLEFLHELGLKDVPDGVSIEYRLMNGSIAPRQRIRCSPPGERNYFTWRKNSGVIVPYGLDRLREAYDAGFLVVAEGESDCWTLWHHGYPALGIPGTTMTGTLQPEYLNDEIAKVYIVQEPGDAGKIFVHQLAEKLCDPAFGWKGDVFVVTLGTVKDPSDLHIADPAGFNAAFSGALDSAIAVDRAAQAVPSTGKGKPVTASNATAKSPEWPKPLAVEAFHGLAGDMVRTIEPHSEADPAALLIQFLTAFGVAAGRFAYFAVEADRHYSNFFAVIVGQTSKSRKGTSWGNIRRVFQMADGDWASSRILTGLSSGEGLTWAVRDAIYKREAVKKNGRVVDYQEVEADAGIADKRLLVPESEFTSALRMMSRDGNCLSPVLRDAWDRGELQLMTKNSPARATGAHVGILGHACREELLRYLNSTEAGNGFANRFLWICAKRSKCLPDGGALREESIVPLADKLREALEFAKGSHDIHRDKEATAMWRGVYPALSEGKPGLLGAVIGRGEAQVVRLSLIYTLLDLSNVIRAEHLAAALAMWDYAESSARFIFGESLGYPEADRLLAALRAAPEGLSRSEVSAVFGRHRSESEIDSALRALTEGGLAEQHSVETQGRSREVWSAKYAK